MPLTDESDSDDETAGPVVDDDEFEVFKVLDGVVDACCCRSPGPVWREPESLDGVVFAYDTGHKALCPVSHTPSRSNPFQPLTRRFEPRKRGRNCS